MTTRAPFPTYRQRFPRGMWRIGSGFRWREWCDCRDGHGRHVFCPYPLPRRLPAHHLGRRRQEQEGKAWALVCIFSSAVDWRKVRA